MTDKEKLIELLQTSPTDIMGNRSVGLLADWLIANGVTIQRWIPVTERLPEMEGRYMVYYGSSESPFVSSIRFAPKSRRGIPKGWHRYDHEDGMIAQNRYITHWMPLPEAPEVF